MKFLILFLALIFQRKAPWLENIEPRAPFREYRDWLSTRGWLSRQKPYLGYGLFVVLPSVLVGLLFAYFDGWFWGLMTLALEVILIALLTLPALAGRYFRHYREHLNHGDVQGAFYCAQQYLVGFTELDKKEDMNTQVIRALMARWFEYFFLILFWYLLLDVTGLILAWLTLIFARECSGVSEAKLNEDSHHEVCEQATEVPIENQSVAASDQDETALADASAVGIPADAEPEHSENRHNFYSFLHWVSWLPARLLGLTYALSGDFSCGFQTWKHALLDKHMSSDQLLMKVASCSLGRSDVADSCCPTDDACKAASELNDWQGLQLRAASIWLVLLAAGTITGWVL